MSATETKKNSGCIRRGETQHHNPFRVVCVTQPGHVLFQARAYDPADPALVESLLLWEGKLIHNIGVRTNGQRVIEEGDPILDWQRFEPGFDPKNPLKVGDLIPNIEVIWGRGRNTAMREACEIRRKQLGSKYGPDDLFLIEAKSWSKATDDELVELMQTENEVRRDTTFLDKVELCMRQLKENRGNYKRASVAARVSEATIKNWEKLWGCDSAVMAAVVAEEIGAKLAWTYFPDVPKEKHKELLALFRASGVRKGAEAEATLARLRDQVLGVKPAAPPPVIHDTPPASATRAAGSPPEATPDVSPRPVTKPVTSPAAPPAGRDTRPLPSSDKPKPGAAVTDGKVATLPQARDVHALRRAATGLKEWATAAHAAGSAEEAKLFKMLTLAMGWASGKDDAFKDYPEVVAALRGDKYVPRASADTGS